MGFTLDRNTVRELAATIASEVVKALSAAQLVNNDAGAAATKIVATEVMHAGPITVDLGRREATARGRAMPLKPRKLDCLAALARTTLVPSGRRGDDVVVTLPAGIGGVFAKHAGDLRTAAVDLKRGLTIWWPMNRTPDSIALLQPVVDAFGKDSGAQLVAVRNLFFGPPERFARWQDSKLRKRFLDAGGLEADFPELHERIVDATFASLPARRFSSNGESGLGYGERLWLKRWLEETTAGFDGLAERVGVGKR
jgi:hypothetical protein